MAKRKRRKKPVSVVMPVAGMLKDLKTVASLVESQGNFVYRSPSDRKRGTKYPVRGSAVIKSILALLKTRPELFPEGTDAAQIQGHFDRAANLQYAATRLTVLLNTVTSTAQCERSDGWSKCLDAYVTARRAGRRDSSVLLQTAPMKAFLARGPRKKPPQ